MTPKLSKSPDFLPGVPPIHWDRRYVVAEMARATSESPRSFIERARAIACSHASWCVAHFKQSGQRSAL